MSTVELNSIVQTILDELTSKWTVIGPVFTTIAGFVWVWMRTGSTHMLTSRLWQLVLGKRELKSKVVTKFLEERDALMWFRSVVGLKRVGTLARAERLINWVDKHDVDIDLVRGSGTLFDLDKPGFSRKPPGMVAQAILTFMAGGLAYVAIILAVVSFMLPPLIQVIKTGTWYTVSADKTRHFQLGERTPIFTADQCKNRSEVVKATSYPAYDVDVLCDMLESEPQAKMLRSSQVSEWIASVVGLCGLTSLFWLFVRGAIQASKAMKLYQRVGDA